MPLSASHGNGSVDVRGLRIEIDCDTVYLELSTAPQWAVSSGKDACGLWADLEFERVRQRLRWIPPWKIPGNGGRSIRE